MLHRSGRSPRAGRPLCGGSEHNQAAESVQAGRRAGSTCSGGERRAAAGAGMARTELRDGVLAAGARRRPARPLFRGERRALLEAAAVDTGEGGIALDAPNRIGPICGG